MARRPLVSRRHRNRPSRAAWQRAIDKLMEIHAQHGYLSQHSLQQAARALGVAPQSLSTRYHRHVRSMDEASAAPGTGALLAIRSAADFQAAYRGLRGGGITSAYAVVERALWRDRSRALAPLRHAERQRRQQLAEAPQCATCAPATGGMA